MDSRSYYKLERRNSETLLSQSTMNDSDSSSSIIDDENVNLGYRDLFRNRERSVEDEYDRDTSQWHTKSRQRPKTADHFDKQSSRKTNKDDRKPYLAPDDFHLHRRWSKTKFALIHEQFRMKDYSDALPEIKECEQSQPTKGFNAASVLTDKSQTFKHLLCDVPSLGKANLPHFTSFTVLNESFGIDEHKDKSVSQIQAAKNLLGNSQDIGKTNEQSESEFQWWYQCVEPKLKGLFGRKTTSDENRGFQFTIPSMGQPIVGTDAFIGAGIAQRYRSRYRGVFNPSPRNFDDELFAHAIVVPPKSIADQVHFESNGCSCSDCNNRTFTDRRSRPLATYVSEAMAEFGSPTTTGNFGVPKNLPFYLDQETNMNLDTNYSSIREAHKRRKAAENSEQNKPNFGTTVVKNQSKASRAGCEVERPLIKKNELSVSRKNEANWGPPGISVMNEPEYAETSDSDCNTDVSEFDGATNIRLEKFIEDTVGAYSGQMDYDKEIDNLTEYMREQINCFDKSILDCTEKSSDGQIFSSYRSPEHMAYYKRHAGMSLQELVEKSKIKSEKRSDDAFDDISDWKCRERNAFKSIYPTINEDFEMCFSNESDNFNEDQAHDNFHTGHLLPGSFEKAQVVLEGMSTAIGEAPLIFKESAKDESTENDSQDEGEVANEQSVNDDEESSAEQETKESVPVKIESKPEPDTGEAPSISSRENAANNMVVKEQKRSFSRTKAKTIIGITNPTSTKKIGNSSNPATKKTSNPSQTLTTKSGKRIPPIPPVKEISKPSTNSSKYNGNARAMLAQKFGNTGWTNKPATQKSDNTNTKAPDQSGHPRTVAKSTASPVVKPVIPRNNQLYNHTNQKLTPKGNVPARSRSKPKFKPLVSTRTETSYAKYTENNNPSKATKPIQGKPKIGSTFNDKYTQSSVQNSLVPSGAASRIFSQDLLQTSVPIIGQNSSCSTTPFLTSSESYSTIIITNPDSEILTTPQLRSVTISANEVDTGTDGTCDEFPSIHLSRNMSNSNFKSQVIESSSPRTSASVEEKVKDIGYSDLFLRQLKNDDNYTLGTSLMSSSFTGATGFPVSNPPSSLRPMSSTAERSIPNPSLNKISKKPDQQIKKAPRNLK